MTKIEFIERSKEWGYSDSEIEEALADMTEILRSLVSSWTMNTSSQFQNRSAIPMGWWRNDTE